MVEKDGDINLSRQCRLLGVGRTSVYYHPFISDQKLALIRLVDEIYTKDPTRGTRRISSIVLKRKHGLEVGRGKVRKLMGMLGLCAIYPKPDLPCRNPEHKVYPYLLRNVRVDRVNQV